MFIGGIAFERVSCLEENKHKNFGRIWYDEETHNASILLHGFRFGQSFCIPYNKIVDPPYLKGDIMISTGEYLKDDSLIKNYMWCGWIYTDSDQRGCVYQIIFEVDPTPILINKSINRKKDGIDMKLGCFLDIQLEDKDERANKVNA